jgi:exodeoxyribonuclease VII small subunit
MRFRNKQHFVIQGMPQKQQDKTFSFEQSLKQLESIVREFEQGDLDLEKGLEKFKLALQLAEVCKKRLDEVENKVIKIKEQFADFNKPI